MKLRRLQMAAGAAVLSMVLAACGGSGSPAATSSGTTTTTSTSGSSAATDTSTSSSAQAPAPPATSGAPVIDPNADLVIWADGTKAPAMQAAAKQFETDNGVTVSVQTVSDLGNQFITASQAGQAPDLILAAHDGTGNLVANGAIDPIQMDAATKAKFRPIALQGVTYDGQIYAVPYATESLFLYRNTDLAPTAPTSIEDMVTQGKALVAAGKATEIMALPVNATGNPYHMYPLLTSAGAYLFGKTSTGDYDPKDLGLTKPEFTAAMQKVADLGKEGALKTSIEDGNLLPFFTGKKTAFMVSGPWNLAQVRKSGVKFDISPIPGFQGMKPAKPFVGVQALYIASKGKHKALAEEFATNFFSTDAVSKALYDVDPRPPATTTSFDAAAATDPLLKIEATAADGGDILPAIPAMSAIWGPLGNAEANVLGGSEVASTVASAATAIQAAIKK
jgi:arabinogalactan oligomer/maltooligosaccharide transport system substrate-binding protein